MKKLSEKKIAVFTALCLISALFMVLIFAGCNSKTDRSGWYSDFDDALNDAGARNKTILLFVNSVYDPPEAKKAVEALTSSDEFTKKMKDFICVHFDFSDEKLLRNSVPVNLTDEEQKIFEKLQNRIKKQFLTANRYSIRTTPALLLLTKEGYYISGVSFNYVDDTPENFAASVLQEEPEIKKVEEMIAKTRKGSDLEKIKAIDEFFEYEPEMYRNLLSSLYRQIPVIDIENKSGLVPKYIKETADTDAFEFISEQKTEEAVQVYETASEDLRNSPEDKQYLYAVAANVVLNSKNPEANRIVELLQKAVDFAPESEYAEKLKSFIATIQKL